MISKLEALFSLPRQLLLKLLAYESETSDFVKDNPGLEGAVLAQKILAQLSLSPSIRQSDKKHIPISGRVVIVANYPLGSLDAFALISLLSDVRPDVKLLSIDMLQAIEPLTPVLLPTEIIQKENKAMLADRPIRSSAETHLLNGGAVVIFPATGISRIEPGGSKDGLWQPYFLKLAAATRSPVLPVHVDNKILLFLYGMSRLWQPLMLFRGLESFGLRATQKIRRKSQKVPIRVGEMISYEAYQELKLPLKTKAKLFRKQCYRLKKDKTSLFKTSTPIAGAEDRHALMLELKRCTRLGETKDDKDIYLYRYSPGSVLMKEIGRLREEAFRLIGEGTDNARDLDAFDESYLHIVLWDRDERELVGAYRLTPTRKVLGETETSSLYTQTLFYYKTNARPILERGLELGRSFVQPKYWGSRSLDYLWMGIAAFLRQHPEYRYLLGAVSISDTFSKPAQDLLVRYYQLYYGAEDSIADCQYPFMLDQEYSTKIDLIFSGLSTKEAFVVLKQRLAEMGFSVPTLYKQYVALCLPGGTRFHGFNIDSDFNDCVDGLVVVDIDALTPAKRKRYGL